MKYDITGDDMDAGSRLLEGMDESATTTTYRLNAITCIII